MRALLRDMPAGVPAECLLARIRGRRSLLIRDWDRVLARQPLSSLPPAPWRRASTGTEGRPLQALQQEHFWVFSRMDEQLRRYTAPFFWLAELRTLSLCLRILTGGRIDLGFLLDRSLLAGSIRNLLRRAVGSAPAVDGLELHLAAHDPDFAGLAETFRTGGPGALEAALYERSLRILSRNRVHPQMCRFVALEIDSRNLITASKRLRWRLNTIPPLLEGGTIPAMRLTELFRRRDSAGLLQLAMRLGGAAPYSESDELEAVLHASRSRVMRRLARGEDGVGTVLDYLCRCGNEAANIGLLERLESMGSEHAEAELRR